MWRIQGLVGRVLHRYHCSNSLRLPPNPHVEDEVINSSAALSTSRHSLDNSRSQEDDGDRRNKQKTFQFGYAELPRYTALDAVGWGAVAVLFMQVCKRIHSKFSSSTEPSPNSGTLTSPSAVQKCGYRILLEILSRRDVLPRGRNVLCLQAVPEAQNQDPSPSQSSSQQHLTADSPIYDHQGEHLYKDSHAPEESLLFESCPQQNDANQNSTKQKDKKEASDEKRLTEAALNLRDVGDNSVPVILNIIGLENAKSENYEDAFTCFLAAAQQGYNKAQFNTGVCYEKGRGVSKNREKALHYYRQAAVCGHKQAQYRYAKLLLASRGQQSEEELNTAVKLLEEAATSGLTKAQICLASFYSRDPVRYGCKFVEYLQMAAESRDDTALFILGQCYDSGFGVQQNLRRAVELYKRAAQAGNKQAKALLTSHNNTFIKAKDLVLRSIRSAPCFTVAENVLQQPLSSPASHVSATLPPLLPHSWSTGNLSMCTHLQLHPRSAEAGACQWTVGVG